MARDGQEGHSYETLKQMVADWRRYAATQHQDIRLLATCMHALQKEIFAMREQERQRLSTAETMRLLTGGTCDAVATVPQPSVITPRMITISHDMAAGPNGTDPMVSYQIPATLLAPVSQMPPPPPATTEPDELRELYDRLCAAVAACRRLLDERDGNR